MGAAMVTPTAPPEPVQLADGHEMGDRQQEDIGETTTLHGQHNDRLQDRGQGEVHGRRLVATKMRPRTWNVLESWL